MTTNSEMVEVVQRVSDTVAWALKRAKPAEVLGALLGASLTVAELVEPTAPVGLITTTLRRIWATALAGNATPKPIIGTVTPVHGKS